MSRRIEIRAWGNAVDRLDMPAYAMCDGFTDHAERVVASIARKNGLEVATLRQDSWTGDSTIYQATLGYPVGGGWCPDAEIWFAV